MLGAWGTLIFSPNFGDFLGWFWYFFFPFSLPPFYWKSGYCGKDWGWRLKPRGQIAVSWGRWEEWLAKLRIAVSFIDKANKSSIKAVKLYIIHFLYAASSNNEPFSSPSMFLITSGNVIAPDHSLNLCRPEKQYSEYETIAVFKRQNW